MFNKVKKDIFALIAILILSFPTYFSLLKPGYFSMHDDLQIMRQYEMEKCFLDGQFPCRWSPDMSAGYGQAMFNYYSVFPYYSGQIFRLLKFSFINTIKISFFLSLVCSGIFIYFLSKEFFGRKGGVISALFFLYGPYHAVDVYVRGALSENWAIAFFPLIFLFIYKLILEKKTGWFIGVIFSLCGLFLSHNIMTMIFLPFSIVWAVFWLVKKKEGKSVFIVFMAFLLAIGISSFFLIPAFFEKNLFSSSWLISDYFSFRNHFVNKNQLFISRFWGYGPSAGINSKMSFQIGWPHWWLVLTVATISLVNFLKKRKTESVIIFFLLFFCFFVFLVHQRSLFIWEMFPLLSFVQFPWRFLGPVLFCSSFIVPGIFLVVKQKKNIIVENGIFTLIIISLIALNFTYFKPEKYFPKINDSDKLNGAEFENAQKSAILDYLPATVKIIPEKLAFENPMAISGRATITEYRKRSNFWRFSIDVSDGKPAEILVPIFDFPNWQILIDQKETLFSREENLGIIKISVPQGRHTVVGWFRNTPIRTLANIISGISIMVLILWLAVNKSIETSTTLQSGNQICASSEVEILPKRKTIYVSRSNDREIPRRRIKNEKII